MFVAVMNLYVSAFSIPIISKIDFYFEGKRQHRFVVFFQIFSTLLKKRVFHAKANVLPNRSTGNDE